MKKIFQTKKLLMAVMLCSICTLVPVVGINAASTNMKTFYIPTILTSKYSDSDHEKSTIKETRAYTDEGLYVSRSVSDEDGLYNRYSVSKRDKKGRVLKEKQYYDQGLDGTYTYTYWKNGKIRKVVYKPAKGSSVSKWNYNKKGYLTYASFKDGKSVDSYTYKYKFNKKGDPTSIIMEWKTKDGSKKAETRKTVKTTIKNTYIKKGTNKGKLRKQVSVARGSKYNESSSTVTTTITNKYNSNGRLTQTTTISRRKDSDGDSYRDKLVTTYQYKTVNVPKRYWKACKYILDGTIFKQLSFEEE